MKAITTKCHGPTNHTSSRISADDMDGNRVYVPYPHELDSQDAHFQAAKALCKKMDWSGKLVAGAIKDGYVFVWMPATYYEIVQVS